MSKLTTGEWIVVALLAIASLANLSGTAQGGTGAAMIWAILAILFAHWRVRRRRRGAVGFFGWLRGDDLRRKENHADYV